MELEAYLTLIVVVLVALVYLVFILKKLVLWGMTRPNSFLKGLSVLNLVGASVLAILVTQFYDRPKDYGAPPYLVFLICMPLMALTLWLAASFGYYIWKRRVEAVSLVVLLFWSASAS